MAQDVRDESKSEQPVVAVREAAAL